MLKLICNDKELWALAKSGDEQKKETMMRSGQLRALISRLCQLQRLGWRHRSRSLDSYSSCLGDRAICACGTEWDGGRYCSGILTSMVRLPREMDTVTLSPTR